MKNLLVRDIDESLVVRLKNKAKARGTSMQAVLKEAVENAAPVTVETKEEILKRIDALRAMTKGKTGPTGLELIHEGRQEQEDKFARIFKWD